ncbi:MAG: hypothetical protein U0X91_29650 [Spirosomataceae bacterium]
MLYSLKYILVSIALFAVADSFRDVESSAEKKPLPDSTVSDNSAFGYTIHLPNTIRKYPLSTEYIFVGTSVKSTPIDFDVIVILPDMTPLAENLKRWRAKKLKIEKINANTLYIKTLCRPAKSVVNFVRFDSGTGVSYCIFHIRGIDTWGNEERALPFDISKRIIANISTAQPTLPLKTRIQLLEEHKKYWATHPFQSIEDSTYINPKVVDDGWGKPDLKGNTKGKRDQILRCMAELF